MQNSKRNSQTKKKTSIYVKKSKEKAKDLQSTQPKAQEMIRKTWENEEKWV